jgi:hypothetical protein
MATQRLRQAFEEFLRKHKAPEADYEDADEHVEEEA